MRILKVDSENLRESERALDEAAQIILRGGVVVFPTDTVYGLAVDATDEAAVRRLFKIKKRPETKPVPVMVPDLEWARKLALFDAKIEQALRQIWPGPVTVVLRHKFRLPQSITAGKPTIGLRIPDYKLVHYLLQKVGRPLTATSANISDLSPSHNVEEILRQFGNETYKPDLVLDAGVLVGARPSTILDLSTVEPKISRLGPVTKDQLANILGFKKNFK